MKLAVKQDSSITPHVLVVYDADMPEGSKRVVARHNTRLNKTWRAQGSAVKATMREINAALSSVQS